MIYDFFEGLITFIMLIIFFPIAIFSLGLCLVYLLSLDHEVGVQNGIISKTENGGIFHESMEIKTIPGISSHFDNDHGHLTIENKEVFNKSLKFVLEGKEVVIQFHCKPTSPFRSSAFGCYADKIEEMKQ